MWGKMIMCTHRQWHHVASIEKKVEALESYLLPGLSLWAQAAQFVTRFEACKY